MCHMVTLAVRNSRKCILNQAAHHPEQNWISIHNTEGVIGFWICTQQPSQDPSPSPLSLFQLFPVHPWGFVCAFFSRQPPGSPRRGEVAILWVLMLPFSYSVKITPNLPNVIWNYFFMSASSLYIRVGFVPNFYSQLLKQCLAYSRCLKFLEQNLWQQVKLTEIHGSQSTLSFLKILFFPLFEVQHVHL